MDVPLLIAILCTKNCSHTKEKQTHLHESMDTEAPMSLVIGRSHATPYSCIFHSTPPNTRHSLPSSTFLILQHFLYPAYMLSCIGCNRLYIYRLQLYPTPISITRSAASYVLTCSFHYSDTSSLVKTFAISVMSCFENVVPQYFPNNVSFWIFVPVIFIHNSVQPSLMNQFSLHKCRILNMRNICVWWNVSSQSF